MDNRPVHAVIWLPSTFYSAVAATLVEMFELVNTIRGAPAISFEFVARRRRAAMRRRLSQAPNATAPSSPRIAGPATSWQTPVFSTESARRSPGG